jgi:hypothetical protein
MAYKIFTGAKPFLKADIRPFNVTEMRMLTERRRNLSMIGETGRIRAESMHNRRRHTNATLRF